MKLQIVLLILLISPPYAAQDWTRFRGPNGSSVDLLSRGLPVEFGPSKNLVWQTTVPFAPSSAIVACGRIFLTASEGDQLITIALSAATGRQVWRRQIRRVRAQQLFRRNDPASPTPAADNENLYVFFPDLGLVSYTCSGLERWRYPLGPFRNFYGMAASPVVSGKLVVLNCDQQSGSFLIAINKDTGQLRWKTERRDIVMGWAVPIVYTPPMGETELIVVCSTRVDSYYLSNGERRWWFPIASDGAMGSPVLDGDTLIVHARGHDEPWLPTFDSVLAEHDHDNDGRLSRAEFSKTDLAAHFGRIDNDSDGFIERKEWDAVRAYSVGENGVIAVRLGDLGQLPASAVRWRFKRGVPYVPAPLLYNKVLYMVRDGGIITSLDAATGAVLKQGRTTAAPGEYYAQPVAADGKIFLVSEAGKMTVLKADPQWEVMSVNDLGEDTYATPALSGGRIYVRTKTAVYCFGSRK